MCETISNELAPPSMYSTWNQTYGTNWQTGRPFLHSFTQSRPYREITDRRQVLTYSLPKDRSAIALAHNPESPCGIMTLSNVIASKRGNFTNVRRDLYSDRQGLWNNGLFNTQGASIDRGVATYSNLQGAWGRIGPSTYDSSHANGEWVPNWGIRCFEPSTLRTLRDHRNCDPRDNWVPIENVPQNMPFSIPYRRQGDMYGDIHPLNQVK